MNSMAKPLYIRINSDGFISKLPNGDPFNSVTLLTEKEIEFAKQSLDKICAVLGTSSDFITN